MVDFDSIMEAAQDAIDVVLDKSAEEDADTDFEASTEVDDQALDAVIGFTDNVLISDKDIEDIDAGKEPGDYDPVDVDAREAEQDKEIQELEQDVTANALVTKDDIKDLKEGASIYDYVDKVINEDVGDIPFSLMMKILVKYVNSVIMLLVNVEMPMFLIQLPILQNWLTKM